MNSPYIELKGITKTFGAVIANNDINLKIYKGEVHALLGENGSGKSTLMNILSGIYTSNEGEILVDGKVTTFSSPAEAIDAKIGMIYQHFKLVDVLTAKQNIIAGEKGGVFLKKKKLTDKINQIANRYGLNLDIDKKIYNMSVGEKQTVEILKVLYRGADVLILDEPTAVLTPQEIKVLFKIINNMKAEGCAIVIITHKMNEVMEISDKVTVLRKGESVKTLTTKDTNIQELTELMVGRAINLDIDRATVDFPDENILDIKKLTIKNNENLDAIHDMSFSVKKGEILGIAGIAGSGQKELCEAIAGLQSINEGDIVFKGESIVGHSPKDIIKKGISMSFIPEDRLGLGLVGNMDIIENVLLKGYQNTPGVFMNRKQGKELAERIVKNYEVSTPSVYHKVKKLSGGNIQKVLLGREIDLNPELLITAYPVRGLDIGASYKVYDVLNEQKKKGVAILFVGEDLDVLLQLCDRLMVIHNGEIMDIVDPTTKTKQDIGLLMLGHKEGEE